MGCIYSHVNEEGNLLSNISAINANHRQYATYFNSVSCGPIRNKLTKRCNKTSTILEFQAHKLAGNTINKRKTGCPGNSKSQSWVTLYLSEVAKLVASTNPELQQLQSCNRLQAPTLSCNSFLKKGTITTSLIRSTLWSSVPLVWLPLA